jgi:hypothetical protein
VQYLEFGSHLNGRAESPPILASPESKIEAMAESAHTRMSAEGNRFE